MVLGRTRSFFRKVGIHAQAAGTRCPHGLMTRTHFFNRKDKHGAPSTFMPSLASRLARPYLASSSPSKGRDMAPVLISFDDWDQGGIFDWYRAQPCTIVHKIELRKERTRFKHEFVVVYLTNGWAYRVDRRPMGGPNTEIILSKGCEAEDSITPLSSKALEDIGCETNVEVELQFRSGRKPDLYAVIAVCVGVRMDPECVLYTLQFYNCYFLARSIITLMVRHYLIRSRSHDRLRWDAVAESTISRLMSADDWNALDLAMRSALITALDGTIWPIVKDDAELLIQKRNQVNDVEETTKRVIREVVEKIQSLVIAPVKSGILQWILGATGETLWYENLERNLSVPHHRQEYESAVTGVLMKMVESQLNSTLPNDMVARLDGLLPKRLINRLPSSLLALLPAEVWGRLPVCLLEKAPDDVIGKVPTDLLVKAPGEFLQKLPSHVFVRSQTSMMLTLPEDLDQIPQRLLNLSLARMQDTLECPTVDHDRSLALRLLKRLPDDILEALPENLRNIRNEEVEEVLGPGLTTDARGDRHRPLMHEPTANRAFGSQPRLPALQGYRKVVRVGLDIAVRLVPRPILERMPGFVVELFPKWAIKEVSAGTLARLPSGFFTGLRGPFLEKLPQEILEKLPEDLLKILPRETLERLPDGLLNRLPEQLLRNIPVELLENLPENISDLIRSAITAEVLEGQRLVFDLVKNAEDAAKQVLHKSSDELPASVLLVSVKKRSKMGNKVHVILGTHQELQNHILDKTRKHSKKVAQVAQFGLGEEAAYRVLRQKTEDVWRVMRLHSTPPPGRLRSAVNELWK